MYTDVLRWTIIPASRMRTWPKLMVPFRLGLGVIESAANYRSLVEIRCRPFIHCMSAVSAYRMDLGEI